MASTDTTYLYSLERTLWQVTPDIFALTYDNHFVTRIDFSIIKSDGTVFPDLAYMGFGKAVIWRSFPVSNGDWYYPESWADSEKVYCYPKGNYTKYTYGGAAGGSPYGLTAPGVYEVPGISDEPILLEPDDYIIFHYKQETPGVTAPWAGSGEFFDLTYSEHDECLYGGENPVRASNSYQPSSDDKTFVDFFALCADLVVSDASYKHGTPYEPDYTWKVFDIDAITQLEDGDESLEVYRNCPILPITFQIVRDGETLTIPSATYEYISLNMRPRWIGSGVIWEHDGNSPTIYCYSAHTNPTTGFQEPYGITDELGYLSGEPVTLQPNDKIIFNKTQYRHFFMYDNEVRFQSASDFDSSDFDFDTQGEETDDYLIEKFFSPFCRTVSIDEPLRKTVWTINSSGYASPEITEGTLFYLPHYLNNDPNTYDYLEARYVNDNRLKLFSGNSISGNSKLLDRGNTIYIKDIGGTDCDDLELINWLNTYAVAKDKVKAEFSTIDYDDEWSTNDCHFEYNKYSDISLDIYSGNIYDGATTEGFEIAGENTFYLSYQVGSLNRKSLSGAWQLQSQTLAPYKNPITTDNALRLRERYNVQLKQSKINEDYAQQELFGQLDKVTKEVDVTIYYSAPDENGRTVSAQKTFKFPLCIAPDTIPLDSFTQSKVAGANNGDKILYYWETPTDPENDISLAGYCVEVERKVGENNWEKIRGLTFDSNNHYDVESIDGTTGITSYELFKDLDYKNPFEEAREEVNEKTNIEYLDDKGEYIPRSFDNKKVRFTALVDSFDGNGTDGNSSNDIIFSDGSRLGLLMYDTYSFWGYEAADRTTVELYRGDYGAYTTYEKTSDYIEIDLTGLTVISGSSLGEPLNMDTWEYGTLTNVIKAEGVSIEKTFVSPSRNPGKDCEAYLANYNKGNYHSFFFTPKGLGLNRGEEFRITIYPYVKYSQYWDENGQLQLSALLTNAGTALGDGKVSKGTVRVYYNNEWKEGQVWVYTGSGWKQAEAVYAYKDGAWKESQ